MLSDGEAGTPRPPRIFLAGDSAAAAREASRAPVTGWGQVLHLFISPDVEIVNCSRAGASARTFTERGRLEWILANIGAGDYLLTSFGINDAKPQEWLRTEAYGDFPRHLRKFVDGARERNAHPVLISPPESDTHDAHGNLPRSITEYPMAMRDLAVECGVPYVNLYDRTHSWWSELGPEGVRPFFVHLEPREHPNHPEGFHDPGHLMPAGALACARYVVHTLVAEQIIPSHWAINLDRPEFPPEWVTWLDDASHHELTRARTLGPGRGADRS
ncbi:GDSL-type esterase/lipase family protein [Streptomyces sp. NBC_01433]|uniref:GDSL-type esterase/lipase family protein n=1 Tax=Streptomyces sp. NBC_01433 TaxID=2903864 RepID=UPI002255B97C|nr:GDSL-type esterase/lipase family protein [Streptomyces sp. NBC_01433]MCX4680564.1 GDSL-type esterase/lipase family protein [Streptomyces sp. NBC_01433]